jgi:hypothetical protein
MLSLPILAIVVGGAAAANRLEAAAPAGISTSGLLTYALSDDEPLIDQLRAANPVGG